MVEARGWRWRNLDTTRLWINECSNAAQVCFVSATTLAHLSHRTPHYTRFQCDEFWFFFFFVLQMWSKYESNAHLSCHYGMLQQYQLGGTSLSPLPALTKFKFSDDIHTLIHTHARTKPFFFWFLNFFFFCGGADSTIRFCSPYRFFSRTTQSNFSHADRVTAVVVASAAKSTIFSLSVTQQPLPLQSINFFVSLSFMGCKLLVLAFWFFFFFVFRRRSAIHFSLPIIFCFRNFFSSFSSWWHSIVSRRRAFYVWMRFVTSIEERTLYTKRTKKNRAKKRNIFTFRRTDSHSLFSYVLELIITRLLHTTTPNSCFLFFLLLDDCSSFPSYFCLTRTQSPFPITNPSRLPSNSAVFNFCICQPAFSPFVPRI